MGHVRFSSGKSFWGWAAVRIGAALLVLLAGAAWLPARGQALPAFSSARVCGESIYGTGEVLRIAQTVRDANGNSYVMGEFSDQATFGPFVLQGFSYNMFVAKLDPAGTVLWAVRVGSKATGQGLAIDAAGNVLVTGWFDGTVAFGSFTLTSTNTNPFASNIFIAKLNPAGIFLWAVRAGGNDSSSGYGITADATGNIYVCGSYTAVFSTADFGPFRLTSNNNSSDVFVAKLTPGGAFVWVTGGGGYQEDYAQGIALDTAGEIYITGTFKAVAQFGATTLTAVSTNHDILVARLSPSGTFRWAAGGGGGASDYGRRVAVDAQGVVHVVGFFMSARPVFGPIALVHPNQSTFNMFAATLTPAGSWQWVVQGGGPGDDYGYDLALDAAGNTYVAGSCSYQATFGNTLLNTAGDQDVMVSKLSPAGAYLWAIQAGGSGDDQATATHLDVNGHLTLAGTTLSSLVVFGTQGFAGNPSAYMGFLAVLATGPLATAAPRRGPDLALWPSPARSGEVIQVLGLLARQPVEVRDALGRLIVDAGPAPVTGALAILLPAKLSSGTYFVRAGQQVCRFTIQ